MALRGRKPSSAPPARPTGDEEKKVVDFIVQREENYRRQLTEPFQRMVKWHELYMGRKGRSDPRTREEKDWRANIHLPYPFGVVETRSSVISDIMNSADPYIQAENIHDVDRENVMQIQKHLNWSLDRNKWPITTGNFSRLASIQGLAIGKVTHRRNGS